MDGQAVLPDHGPTAPAAPSLGKQASLPERPDQPLSSPHPRFPTSSEAAFSPGQLNLPQPMVLTRPGAQAESMALGQWVMG